MFTVENRIHGNLSKVVYSVTLNWEHNKWDEEEDRCSISNPAFLVSQHGILN